MLLSVYLSTALLREGTTRTQALRLFHFIFCDNNQAQTCANGKIVCYCVEYLESLLDSPSAICQVFRRKCDKIWMT